MDLKGITVRRVLVTPASAIVRELYLAAVLDRTSRRVLLMGSAQGGVDIEELAASDPGAITAIAAHPHLGLQDHRARRMAFALGLALFIITLILNLIALHVVRKYREAYE